MRARILLNRLLTGISSFLVNVLGQILALVLVVLLACILVAGVLTFLDWLEDPWERAEQLNSIEAYERFLIEYADHPNAAIARERFDELTAWAAAELTNTQDVYSEFLARFPHGQMRGACLANLSILHIDVSRVPTHDSCSADLINYLMSIGKSKMEQRKREVRSPVFVLPIEPDLALLQDILFPGLRPNCEDTASHVVITYSISRRGDYHSTDLFENTLVCEGLLLNARIFVYLDGNYSLIYDEESRSPRSVRSTEELLYKTVEKMMARMHGHFGQIESPRMGVSMEELVGTVLRYATDLDTGNKKRFLTARQHEKAMIIHRRLYVR